jgi:hypothetical protein
MESLNRRMNAGSACNRQLARPPRPSFVRILLVALREALRDVLLAGTLAGALLGGASMLLLAVHEHSEPGRTSTRAILCNPRPLRDSVELCRQLDEAADLRNALQFRFGH